jgi:hypothetical protein
MEGGAPGRACETTGAFEPHAPDRSKVAGGGDPFYLDRPGATRITRER